MEYTRQTTIRKRRAVRRRKKRIRVGVCLILAVGIVLNAKMLVHVFQNLEDVRIQKFLDSIQHKDYPDELLEMLEHNEEAYDYVVNYPKRELYKGQKIDLAGICSVGESPLLLQWDLRWGYDSYGESMIGIAGCGPTCMTMAYLCLTEDTSMNPRKMAQYAAENGYHSEAGTSWSFFTEGASGLGLTGREISLAEPVMKQALDQGGVIICSMRPGDFTTTGHFILLKGYDENGFFVNDPNSRKNSDRQWDFDTLSGQIKGLWEITK